MGCDPSLTLKGFSLPILMYERNTGAKMLFFNYLHDEDHLPRLVALQNYKMIQFGYLFFDFTLL